LILHSGQGPQSIVTGRVRKWLFNNLDQTNFGRAFLCINPTVNEVWVCFPGVGATTCNMALVWNWENDTFGERDLHNVTYGNVGTVASTPVDGTWAADGSPWSNDTSAWNVEDFSTTQSRLLLTQTNPVIVQAETGALFNGEAPTCVLERTGITLDKPDVIKTVRSIVPRIDASAGTQLSIEVGAAMDAEGSYTYSPAFTYTVGTSRKADCFATGRFLALRITSTTAQPWRLKSYDLDIIEHGLY